MSTIPGTPGPIGGAARIPTHDERIDEMVFNIKDQNHNGWLTRDEFIVPRSTAAQIRAQNATFATYDNNHDGFVSRSEFMIARSLKRLRDALDNRFKK